MWQSFWSVWSLQYDLSLHRRVLSKIRLKDSRSNILQNKSLPLQTTIQIAYKIQLLIASPCIAWSFFWIIFITSILAIVDSIAQILCIQTLLLRSTHELILTHHSRMFVVNSGNALAPIPIQGKSIWTLAHRSFWCIKTQSWAFCFNAVIHSSLRHIIENFQIRYRMFFNSQSYHLSEKLVDKKLFSGRFVGQGS